MRLWEFAQECKRQRDAAIEQRDASRRVHAIAVEQSERDAKLIAAYERECKAWHQQCDEQAEDIARLVRENANPVSAAYETLGGTLQKIVACAGGKIELDPDAVRSCNGAFLASIPTLAGGLILVNAVKPGALSNGKET